MALQFTQDQLAIYKANFAANATEDQFRLFISECERRTLIPGAHVIFQLRKGTEYNAGLNRRVDVQKVVMITTINALRLIAQRSNKFRGYGKFVYYYASRDGEAFVESLIPYGRTPHAVSVEAFREGWIQPVLSVARYEAFVQVWRNGDKEVATRMWQVRAEEQLAKCAEAQALRMVAPEECGGLYIKEEFERGQDIAAEEIALLNQGAGLNSQENIGTSLLPSAPPVVIPSATVAPPVNQEPAPVQPQQPTPVVAPSKPAPPKPTVRPVAPPTPKPVPTTPAQAVEPVKRQPQPEQPVRESVSELNEVADRIARDKDPKPTASTGQPVQTDLPGVENVHGLVITDEDLPENLRAGYVADPAPTPDEYQAIMQRLAKIVRDKLEKEGGLKKAGELAKDWLLTKAGVQKLQKIGKNKFNELATILENASAADAVKLVKEK